MLVLTHYIAVRVRVRVEVAKGRGGRPVCDISLRILDECGYKWKLMSSPCFIGICIAVYTTAEPVR